MSAANLTGWKWADPSKSRRDNLLAERASIRANFGYCYSPESKIVARARLAEIDRELAAEVAA